MMHFDTATRLPERFERPVTAQGFIHDD